MHLAFVNDMNFSILRRLIQYIHLSMQTVKEGYANEKVKQFLLAMREAKEILDFTDEQFTSNDAQIYVGTFVFNSNGIRQDLHYKTSENHISIGIYDSTNTAIIRELLVTIAEDVPRLIHARLIYTGGDNDRRWELFMFPESGQLDVYTSDNGASTMSFTDYKDELLPLSESIPVTGRDVAIGRGLLEVYNAKLKLTI